MLVGARPEPHARARLVCFAHAGGGPGAFRRWPAAFGPDLEVLTAPLPGRATRGDEPFPRCWTGLVDGLADAVASSADERPTALLGHSLGGIVAFEVARALDRRSAAPAHLFAAGSRAPHRLDPHWKIPADDIRLVEEVDVRYGAVPPAVRAEPEVLRRFVPVLRADLELAASYAHTPGPPLSCPITALGGLRDRGVSAADLEQWGELTAAGFASLILPGAHFFLHDEVAAVAKLVRRAVAPGAAVDAVSRHR